ncbi:LPS assembly lipoprotein LptE [Pontiella agarivorans]|uniref:LPS assembly lipoprotein LptE n=1 Tax=Pontiella agarivorans TaxID=3038953 RepID=A0ABU5MYX0_9BACT|nr:LPS assembly lipoprotein LptE [Pontiella agarivorans]MDZ8119406.1 LPS assembly lipoprotein LptE [Pontiella agarivorans]
MKRRLLLTGTLTSTLLFSGCMGYQLGGTTHAGINSAALAPVINNTSEPAIETQVTHAMRNRLQFDGRIKLVNQVEQADAVVEITLTKYNIQPIAYKTEEGQRTTPDLYRLRITGKAELRSTDTGEVIASSATYGESTFSFTSDLTTSKRNALPPAADEIAKFMLDDLIEAWN